MLTIIHIAELIAFLCVLFMYYKERTASFLLLCILVSFVIIAENYKKIMILDSAFHLTILNTIACLEFIFYFLIYQSILKNNKFKKTALGLLLLFTSVFIINSIFYQPLNSSFQSHSYLTGSLGIFICIFLYLYETINLLKPSDNIFNIFWIWISIGLFIFLATETPVMIFYQFSIENKISMKDFNGYLIKHLVTTLYYSLFLIATVCQRTLN